MNFEPHLTFESSARVLRVSKITIIATKIAATTIVVTPNIINFFLLILHKPCKNINVKN